MNQCFLDSENSPEGMKLEQVKVNSRKEWKTYIGTHSGSYCVQYQGTLGYKVYSNLEAVLVKVVKKEN